MSIERSPDSGRGDLTVPGEHALVDAAAGGDRAAFDSLVLLHERIAVRTALAALGHREEAEDVTQDAFLLAWQRLPGFRAEASFRTWLLTIVWRLAVARRRVQQRWWQRFVPGSASDDGQWSTPPCRESDPETQAAGREQARAVAAAITRLSPKLRDALLLASSGEHTYVEIAQLLGIAAGTVKWRVSEARRLVAREIGRARED